MSYTLSQKMLTAPAIRCTARHWEKHPGLASSIGITRQKRQHRPDHGHLAPRRQKQAGKQVKEKWDIAAKECRDLNAVFDQNTGKEKSINCSQHQAIGRMKTHTTINHSTSST
ncbi:hypothetical protein [Janthinobacterium lividum]|uniref:Uncharacterized protein n=1 Tax=Janthinobacterium lividum TaxID=29581 RepID=A0ABU0XRW0_9BURK|nr:hypothetical protein [Janthinobacterium lividum]MDQ4626266.1 hypothetical protein [Janthinobacterium lividum]MDQ4674767.1 hypothetical protein [Janthinobacterium lividum]MDQ4685499.1 hypothetical protein [Janthinobacterium lividum]